MAPYVQIEFEGNDKRIYSPGEKVVGNVVVENPNDEKLNAIKVRFRGKAHNEWYDPAVRYNIEGIEYYVDNTVSVWPQQSAVNQDTLPRGMHRFPFSFLLPENAPCSFEGYVGWLRYSVYVTLDMPGKNQETKSILTVLPKADLNQDEQAKITPEAYVREDIGYFNTKPLIIKASCNKGGYVPGETITVNLDIDNQSDSDVSSIKVVLEQKSKFAAKSWRTTHYTKKSDAAAMKEKPLIRKHTHQQWSGKLVVPSLPPSYLPGCSIIDLKFRLQFRIKCSKTVTFQLPIVIGTIPLASPGEEVSPNPPSYLESVFGSVDAKEEENEEVVGGKEYTPLYTYYKWS